MIPGNFSNNEIYRATGTLPTERIERLLEVEETIDEAIGCELPESTVLYEDDLDGVVKILNKIAVSGYEKKLLDKAIQRLREIEERVFQVQEYHEELLEHQRSVIEKVESIIYRKG